MNGFLARQLREITASVETLGGRLLGLVALVILALIFVIAGFAFLSVALYIKVAAIEGAAIAALAVAGLCILIAIICLVMLRVKRLDAKSSRKAPPPNKIVEDPAEKNEAAFAESIDQTIAPFIAVLHEANLKPEEVALRLGTSLTKKVGPLGLVALALVAGFLFAGRLTGGKKEVKPR